MCVGIVIEKTTKAASSVLLKLKKIYDLENCCSKTAM